MKTFTNKKSATRFEKLQPLLLEISNTKTQWIENAAYYLHEHDIILLNFISVESICLSLIGGEYEVSLLFKLKAFLRRCIISNSLQKQYKILLKQMRSYYDDSSVHHKTNLKEEEIVVVYAEHDDLYYRAKIIEVSSDRVIFPYH